MAGTLTAQAPPPWAMNYQAVARNSSGQLLENEDLTVKIGIYSGPAATVKVYEETHDVTTNQFGQFNLMIGKGTLLYGFFSLIEWDSDEHHLKVEINPGTGYVNLGTTQLVTVPYAYHAKTSNQAVNMKLHDLTNVSSTSPAIGQILGWNGADWLPVNDNAGLWSLSGSNAYYNSGKVGIGTNNPEQQLGVYTSSGVSYIQVSDNTTGVNSGVRFGLNGAGNAYIINDFAGKALNLGTGGTTHLTMASNGTVGLNAVSPNTTMVLHMKQTNSNYCYRIEHNTTTDTWDIGIGLNTKNHKFVFNGSSMADVSSTDGAYVQWSDREVKQDINALESVLEGISLLKPYTYRYINNEGNGPLSYGFIAQDVAQIFPDLVRDMDGHKGIVYDGFAVLSIKAIQELNDRIEALEQEVEALRMSAGHVDGQK